MMYVCARRALTTVALVGALSAAACGDAAADRAGGESPDEHVVLTYSNKSDLIPVQMLAYSERVSELTDGSVTIEYSVGSSEGDADYEHHLVDDVRQGTVDLGVVRLRVFDTLGVDDFQPLVAPLLIDSYELQQAVLAEGIAEPMLSSVDELDVTGVAVLPGPMFRIVGRAHPFLAPGDFAGQRIAHHRSDVSAAAITAFGGTPVKWVPGSPLAQYDAIALQIATVWTRHVQLEADSVTSNLVMWPGTNVLIANPDTFDALSERQQAALRTAADEVLGAMITATRDEDAEATRALCDAGLDFALASDAQLAELRSALEPVYADIAGHGDNAAVLDRITALKAELGADPDAPTCPAEAPTAGAGDTAGPDFPEGTFSYSLTDDDFVDICGFNPQLGKEHDEVTFADGYVEHVIVHPDGRREIGFQASYTVYRDRIEFAEIGFPPLNFRWTFDGSQLVLSDLVDDNGECIHRVVWTSHPMTLVAGPSATAVDAG